MKHSLLHLIYNGLLRFVPLSKVLHFKTAKESVFPRIGFLDASKKADLEKNLGITIHNIEIFEQAFIHRSYLPVIGSNKVQANERLEFLGDAILGMIVSEYLFSLHYNYSEGELTKTRSWLVNKYSLALCAQKLNLDKFLMMSHGASKTLENGGESILSDCLEAIIAAIYLDSGIESAKKFFHNTCLPILMTSEVMTDHNYKSLLLELVQSEGKNPPSYTVLEETGPDHCKEFTVGVYIENKLIAQGKGKSKKSAEQTAAKNALEILKKRL